MAILFSLNLMFNMGHFGFSYIGCIFLVLLFVPNLFFLSNKPQNYTSKNENPILVCLERVGEVSTSTCAILFSDFNLKPLNLWSIFFFLACIMMFLYEIFWIRYFRSEKRMCDFYRSFLKIPVAGATLPVLAFLLLGIYGKVFWLMIAAIILGVGHIGIHLQHKKEI